MTPVRIGDDWFVMRGGDQIAGPLKSNSDAWRWIDRQTGQPVSKTEQRSEWVFEQSAGGHGL